MKKRNKKNSYDVEGPGCGCNDDVDALTGGGEVEVDALIVGSGVEAPLFLIVGSGVDLPLLLIDVEAPLLFFARSNVEVLATSGRFNILYNSSTS